MKEELENTMDVEQLLRGKSWEQLNEAEREAAVEALGDQVNYDRVRGMMMELRAETGIEEEALQPSKHVRENLLAAFDEEQRRRRVLWWNSLGFWLRDQLRLDIPIVRLALAGVILVLGIFAVMQVTGDETPGQTIANQQTPPVPVDENNGRKLDDNVEPPGMNVQPMTFPWSFYPPAPVNPEEDDVVVVEDVMPPLKDSVTNPQQGNIVAVADSVSHEFAVGVMDTTASPLVVSFTDATCLGSNANLTATGSGATYNFMWVTPVNASVSPTATNSNMASVYVVAPPNCRSLANDSKVINAMFSMK